MKNTSMVLGLGAAVVTMALYSACSDDNGTPAANGDGGPSTTGGSTSVSTEVTGGSTSTDTSAGGTTTAIGGATSTAPTGQVINSFSTSQQAGLFTPSTYVNTDCKVNVAAPTFDAGAFSVDWSGSVDVNDDAVAPNAGSLKVTATFTNWNQSWEVDMAAPTDSNGNPIDLTNKLVTAQIKVVEGISPYASYPSGAQIFVKTGSGNVWGASKWTNIESTASWVTLRLDITDPQGVPSGAEFDPTQPVQLGVTFSTNGGGEATWCSGDYAQAFGPPLTMIAYIDDIEIQDRP